jgi:hypothetical protein
VLRFGPNLGFGIGLGPNEQLTYLIQKENFTGEHRQKIVIEGELIGDYLDEIKQLENIIDENEIVDKFQSIKIT